MPIWIPKEELIPSVVPIQQLNPEDKITLVINSPGGLITEGRALINAFLNTGAEIKTELISEAASMAAIMFCIGHKRIVHESTSMMFHNFSTGYMGKGDEIKDYIKHATKNNLAFFRAHILGLSEEEIYRMVDGKEWWFDTKKMCQRGIATHVNVNGLIIPAAKYLKILKKTKKTAKKVLGKDIKINSLREALIYKIDALSPIAEEKQKTFQEIQTQIAEMVETYDHDDS